MGRFDFSPEALDEGLTTEDVSEFSIKCSDFDIQAAKVRQASASAVNTADLVTSYLELGKEVFAIAGKAVAVRAAKIEVPSTRLRLVDRLKNRLSSVFDRFASGKDD